MESVRHDGRRTAYEVSDRGGEGAGLLCIHGSGGSHGVWRAQHRLATERPVAALDLSGHGDSEDCGTTAGPETLAAYAADVEAVADTTGARVLCGNSLGGAVAMQVALDGDLDPAALVLVGTGAKLGVRADLLGWLGSDFDRAVDFLLGPNRLLASDDPRYLNAAAAELREAGARVLERDFRSSHTFDIRDRLSEITTPSLALTGAVDELTPPAYHEYLAENLPRGEWTTIEGAAHLSMLERPEAFNEAVSGFLEGR